MDHAFRFEAEIMHKYRANKPKSIVIYPQDEKKRLFSMKNNFTPLRKHQWFSQKTLLMTSVQASHINTDHRGRMAFDLPLLFPKNKKDIFIILLEPALALCIS